jgi:hypothetical protein
LETGGTSLWVELQPLSADEVVRRNVEISIKTQKPVSAVSQF